MRVITLDSKAFAAACQQLQQAVSAVFVPDMVIGIATGGVFVAEHMFACESDHAKVYCHRPSTSLKGKIFKAIARLLPMSAADSLRVFEAKALRRFRRAKLPALQLPPEVVTAIEKSMKILVVDDAVDSGATLRRVLDAVRAAASARAVVLSAAITVTTEHPSVRPDFCIYNDSTLIRFPWSADSAPQQ